MNGDPKDIVLDEPTPAQALEHEGLRVAVRRILVSLEGGQKKEWTPQGQRAKKRFGLFAGISLP
jgi:hypothetical protein